MPVSQRMPLHTPRPGPQFEPTFTELPRGQAGGGAWLPGMRPRRGFSLLSPPPSTDDRMTGCISTAGLGQGPTAGMTSGTPTLPWGTVSMVLAEPESSCEGGTGPQTAQDVAAGKAGSCPCWRSPETPCSFLPPEKGRKVKSVDLGVKVTWPQL